MYAYFDDTKRFWSYLLIYYVSCIPLYALFRSLHISIIFTVVIILFLEMISYLVIINITVNKANRYMSEIENLLYQTCDVKQFQTEIYKLLERQVKNQTQYCSLIDLLAISKTIQGKSDEAITLYEEIREAIERLNKDQKWSIYINMAHSYMSAKDLQNADTYLQKAIDAKIHAKLHKKQEDGVVEEAKHRYQYMIGEECSRDYILFLKKTCKEQTGTPIHQLCMYAQLMEMSKRTKNQNESLMCAYYIVKHAKDLPCVEAANKLLDGVYE